MDKIEFIDRKVYRCRVVIGSFCKKSPTKGTPFIHIPLEVAGGEMSGAKLQRDIFLTDKTRESATAELEILTGKTDFSQVNFRDLDPLIVGKEVAAECRVEERGGKSYAVANRIVDPASIVPGAAEAQVADFFGSKATPPPDPDGFNDRY